MGDYNLNDQEADELIQIATNVATKKYDTYRYYDVSFDDVRAYLIDKGLQLYKKYNKIDANLFYKAFYNDVVDIIRREQRKKNNQKSMDGSQIDYELSKGDKHSYLTTDQDHSELIFSQILKSMGGKPAGEDFPSSKTKNREYWYIWLLINLDSNWEGADPNIEEKLRALPENAWLKNDYWQTPNKRTGELRFPQEDVIACTLGYAGSKSKGYQDLKRRVKDKLNAEGYND